MKMACFIIFILVAITSLFGQGQKKWLSNIKQQMSQVDDEESLVRALTQFANYYKHEKPDSAIYFGYEALALAKEIDYKLGEVEALLILAISYLSAGNHAKAHQLSSQSLRIAEDYNLPETYAFAILISAEVNLQTREFTRSLEQLAEARNIFDSLQNQTYIVATNCRIGEILLALGHADSARQSFQLALQQIEFFELVFNWYRHETYLGLAQAESALGNPDIALPYFLLSLKHAKEAEMVIQSTMAIARHYQKSEQSDSAIHYAQEAFAIAEMNGFRNHLVMSARLLSELYEKEDVILALSFSRTALALKDSLNDHINQATNETISNFNERMRLADLHETQLEAKAHQRNIIFFAITLILIVIWINSALRNKLKNNASRKIEKAYHQLKATQSQLIHSEKMASLGELTAGIAHEIQNPLNFVNNFSEVSEELISEAREELDKGDISEAKSILDDLNQNLNKINHHGGRASSIVKGMLDHSRTSSGEKVPIDINKLCDEYVRLAYHGMRAKDKSFNVMYETDFQDDIPPINIVPQDIGRVILNLVNNAFQAVQDYTPSKELNTERTQSEAEEYQPMIKIKTALTGGHPGFNLSEVEVTTGVGGQRWLVITISDNGPGIPDEIRDKIFQPFFTTKPAGQGTGLGLSLSYDIVKAHSGDISVESGTNIGTIFSVQLPITNIPG